MRTAASGKVILLHLLFAVAAVPWPAMAAEQNAQSEESQSIPAFVDLKWQERDFSLFSWHVSISHHSEPFPQEPALVPSPDIARGVLELGNHPDHHVAFIWDKGGHKLYLDLNRNLDLTDDPNGISTADPRNRSRYLQVFRDLRVDFNTDTGVHRGLFDLRMHIFGVEAPVGYGELRSFWQGKLELNGREFEIGLAQNLEGHIGTPHSGYLLLRPWDSKDKQFGLVSGALDGFNLTRCLFFLDRAFQLDFDCLTPAGGEASVYRMKLIPLTPALGALEIEGKSIKRAVLVSPPYTVVLDSPGAKAMIPTGRYEECQVLLESSAGTEAHLEHRSRFGPFDPIHVNSETAAILKAGGPLTNSVNVTRRGKHLNLSYQVVGADGRTYQLRNQDRSQPPRFTIQQNGSQVHAGQFEYG
jgi:hypothetical protein